MILNHLSPSDWTTGPYCWGDSGLEPQYSGTYQCFTTYLVYASTYNLSYAAHRMRGDTGCDPALQPLRYVGLLLSTTVGKDFDSFSTTPQESLCVTVQWFLRILSG